MRRPPLRVWLIGAMLAILTVPPLTAWLAYLTAGADQTKASDLAAARSYAIAAVDRWTDPGWQRAARTYFADHHVDVELRPASGPWFTTVPAGASAPTPRPEDKFSVPDATHPNAGAGSGWIVPRSTAQTNWTAPAVGAGAGMLATVALSGWLLGITVVRPLTATGRAATRVADGTLDVRLPQTRVREVHDLTTAMTTMVNRLQEAAAQQENLDEQRRLFVAAIAHDLRTPVFTLRAHLDGLADGLATTPEKTNRYLRTCRTSAAALDRLINDLVESARLDLLDQEPRRVPLDLSTLIHQAVRASQPAADAKRVTITVDGCDKPHPTTGDPDLLTRAVRNLLDNAIRHARSNGHVYLSCRAELDTGRELLRVTLTDDGPGISPVDLPHLFDPLYRGDAARSSTHSGAGLGLTIARRVLRAHGGDLTAANAPTGGASLTALLPTSTSSPSRSPDHQTGAAHRPGDDSVGA